MAEKEIWAAQNLTEALKHPEPESTYAQISYNKLEAIDALSKIFSQQVQEKGILTTSQYQLWGWEGVHTQ